MHGTFNLLLIETNCSSCLPSESTPIVIGSEEENAGRYASGYVARCFGSRAYVAISTTLKKKNVELLM